MAYTNVASCVISIVGSFSNGLDVFKRLRDKRRGRKRSKRTDAVDEKELRLSRSLRQGQEDIGREYQRSVYGAGQDFEIGDAIAHTALAEIILRLNTGLVSIIASFLKNDKNCVDLDYQSLTELSERSRIDTCRTLRQLFKRTTRLRQPLKITDSNRIYSHHGLAAKEVMPKKRSPRVKSTKVRGPMVAQVIIADSSKPPQLAMVRPGEPRKKSTSSSGGSSLSKAHSESSSAPSTPPPEYASFDSHRPTVHRAQTAPEVPQPRRKQSSANVSSQPRPSNADKFRATQSTSRLDTTLPSAPFEPLPPLPNMAAMSTASLQPRRRKPTPTYYSVASGHTQIGEIPLHEWAEPYDFDQASIMNHEAYRNGWPANQLSEQEKRKRRFGLGRLFSRK